MAYDRELISNGNPMEAIVGFSRAVRVGPFVSIGGTAPVGLDGKTVGVGMSRRRQGNVSKLSRRPWKRPVPGCMMWCERGLS